jgi:hypothetical protein
MIHKYVAIVSRLYRVEKYRKVAVTMAIDADGRCHSIFLFFRVRCENLCVLLSVCLCCVAVLR